jgi:hypothetical protein
MLASIGANSSLGSNTRNRLHSMTNNNVTIAPFLEGSDEYNGPSISEEIDQYIMGNQEPNFGFDAFNNNGFAKDKHKDQYNNFGIEPENFDRDTLEAKEDLLHVI